MTVRPEDQPMPLDEGGDQRVGRPPGAVADDGKTGGQSQGGRTAQPTAHGDGAGENAQRGGQSGSENEREAPGMSTEKKADDTK